MFCESDPERALPPLLQIERTAIGKVTSLFCFQSARHVGIMYHEDMLGIEPAPGDPAERLR